jgi:hypothetical protein
MESIIDIMKVIFNILCHSVVLVFLCSCTSNVRIKEEHKATMVRDTQYVLDRVKFDRTPIKGGFDSEGRKSGLWFEKGCSTYYQGGQKNGVSVSYDGNQLYSIGEYVQGRPVGTWHYFKDGNIFFTVSGFKENKNKRFQYELDGKTYNVLTKYEGYVVDYYPNNIKKDEGIILYDDDLEWEYDYVRYGLWSYYDESGKLIKREHPKE